MLEQTHFCSCRGQDTTSFKCRSFLSLYRGQPAGSRRERGTEVGHRWMKNGHGVTLQHTDGEDLMLLPTEI